MLLALVTPWNSSRLEVLWFLFSLLSLASVLHLSVCNLVCYPGPSLLFFSVSAVLKVGKEIPLEMSLLLSLYWPITVVVQESTSQLTHPVSLNSLFLQPKKEFVLKSQQITRGLLQPYHLAPLTAIQLGFGRITALYF